MGDVVPMGRKLVEPWPTVRKVVDGETIFAINVDAMTPHQRAAFFEQSSGLSADNQRPPADKKVRPLR